MRTWDTFFPDVLPEVLGCPEPTVERHIFNAAREFCQKSRCWRDDLDRITTSASRSTYDLSCPDDGEPVELVGAALAGADIGLEVADGTSTADRRAGSSGANRVLSQDLVTVQLLPTPAQGGQELRLTAILMPREGALGLPDRIADKYRLAIANGALATLLVINKAAWRDPALAAVKAGLFKDAISDTRQRMHRANTNRRPRTVANWY